MMARGRRSNTSCTAFSMTSSSMLPVPKVSIMSDTGLATPMA